MLARAFYALKDTKTPVVTTIVAITINIVLSFWFILVLRIGVWGLAFSYSIGALVQAIILAFLLNKRMLFVTWDFIRGVIKITISASFSGAIMYFLLKILDQAVWDKRLSFLDSVGLALPTSFQLFVLDTRYTANLVFLTLFVVTAGSLIYLVLATLLRCREIEILAGWISKISQREISLPAVASAEGKVEIPAPLSPGG